MPKHKEKGHRSVSHLLGMFCIVVKQDTGCDTEDFTQIEHVQMDLKSTEKGTYFYFLLVSSLLNLLKQFNFELINSFSLSC